MPARSTQPSIEDIFSMAQESCAKHKKCAAALRKLQSSMPFEEFAADFFSCVACVLPVFKRERAVERIVEFVVAYTTLSEPPACSVARVNAHTVSPT